LVSNISVPLRFVFVPNALAMAHLYIVASLLAILPLSSSRFCPLAPLLPLSAPWLGPYCLLSAGTLLLHYGWHPTARHRRLASALPVGPARPLPFRSVDPSSVTPSGGIALPPWLCPTPWINVMTCPTVQYGFAGPSSFEFSYVAGRLSSPCGQRFWPLESFLLFW